MSQLEDFLKNQPKYRQKQIEAAWFDPAIKSYTEITTLPQELRSQLASLPWLSVRQKLLQKSKIDQTWRALLELSEGELVETVLMGRDDRFTICISSQVGCAMNCAFCATGQSGFKRNLSAEEIIDQARFWHYFLQEKFSNCNPKPRCYVGEGSPKVSNVVMMGQGESFLNYDNVRTALQVILANTDIGPTKITVSTVGVPTAMERLLEDAYFPPVRLAISLHSAIDETRKKLIPSHQPDFFVFLENWVKRYHQRFNSRSYFIGFEYVMLEGINDDEKHFKALVKFLSKMGRLRINLIPYNNIGVDAVFKNECSPDPTQGRSPDLQRGVGKEKIKDWHDRLLDLGFICTTRRSQGQDIFAACGQLRNSI